MYALITGIYETGMQMSGVLLWIIDFGINHLSPLVHVLLMCKTIGYTVLSSELIGYGGLCFTAMLIRLLWNALRGAGA